jgi:thioredoxin-related protein
MYPLCAALQWHEDLTEAQGLAANEDKALFLYFTGSDWCPACVSFDKNILSQDAFSQHVENKFVFVKIDFPLKKKLPLDTQNRNHALKQRFHVKGVPTVVVTSPDLRSITQLGYLRVSPEDYAQHLLTSIQNQDKVQ